MREMIAIISMVFASIFIITSNGFAEMVMYRDANGVLCFSNTGPPLDSEVQETYGETKSGVSSPEKYEPVEKQEQHQTNVKVMENEVEIKKQKNKKEQTQFEHEIALEKRRLEERLMYYQNDCPKSRKYKDTYTSRQSEFIQRSKKTHNDFCREKYNQIFNSIELLEKDSEYYFYKKQENQKNETGVSHANQNETGISHSNKNQGTTINNEWDTNGNHYTPAGGGNKWRQDGTFMQKAAGGYIDTKTGQFIPSN